MNSTIRKDILKAVAVLASIALIAGILLGVVYPLTRLTEQELLDRAKKPLADIYPAEGYEGIVFEGEADYLFKVLGEDNTYITVATGGGGYGGDVTMYVVIKENKIIKLEKGKNSETPGTSDKAFSAEFYSQFYDVDVTKTQQFTLKGNVDAAVGATKTSTGIVNAVNVAVKHYNAYLQKQQSDEVQAPLKEVYPAEGYEEISFKGGAEHFFRVVGEKDTYIAIATGSGGYRGDVSMYVVIKENKIIKLSKGKNNETPSISANAFSDDFYAQFYGVDVTNTQQFVLKENVDAAVGATKTSTGIVNAVNVAIKHYNDYLAEVKA